MMGEEAMGAKAAKAAAKAAADAAAAAAKEQRAVNRQLLASSVDSDGMQHAADLYGRRQAVKQRMVLNLYRPLARLLGVGKDYFEGDFARDLAATMSKVPDEHLQAPSAPLAGRAMQGLAFALDEPDLKRLYLELLKSASDDRTASDAHPSFVDVIGQINAEEAVYLQRFLATDDLNQVARLNQQESPGISKTRLVNHLIDLRFDEGEDFSVDPHMAAYLDNWQRLGLIEIHYDGRATADGAYEWLEEHPWTAQMRESIDHLNELPLPEGVERLVLQIDRGYFRRTEYGRLFAESALPEVESPALLTDQADGGGNA